MQLIDIKLLYLILYVGILKGWPSLLTHFVFECYGRLGECTIKLWYISFLMTIIFRRVGSTWNPTLYNYVIFVSIKYLNVYFNWVIFHEMPSCIVHVCRKIEKKKKTLNMS